MLVEEKWAGAAAQSSFRLVDVQAAGEAAPVLPGARWHTGLREPGGADGGGWKRQRRSAGCVPLEDVAWDRFLDWADACAAAAGGGPCGECLLSLEGRCRFAGSLSRVIYREEGRAPRLAPGRYAAVTGKDGGVYELFWARRMSVYIYSLLRRMGIRGFHHPSEAQRFI